MMRPVAYPHPAMSAQVKRIMPMPPKRRRGENFFWIMRSASGPRVEDDRVHDGHHSALRLRERKTAEPAHDAADDALVRQVAAAVRRHRDGARPVDHELDRDAPLQAGV